MRLADYIREFNLAAKRILKKDISKNFDTLCIYRQDIVRTFNDLAAYCFNILHLNNEKQRNSLKTTYITAKEKLIKCLDKLQCEFHIVAKPFETIDLNTVSLPNQPNTDDSLPLDESNLVQDTADDFYFDLNDFFQQFEMSISVMEFVKLCGETIPNAFTGDPLHLQAFLASIDLLNSIASSATNATDLAPKLVSFLRTRMHAKVVENLTPEDNTIDAIKARLQGTIKPENEKIIRGKMAALKSDRNTMAEFAKQADALAESLKRSLVLDGIPSEKANRMTIDETIAMCKNSTRSDYVKSVIASSAYTTAKEVVAKFVIESSNDKSDKQVLFLQRNNNNRRYAQPRRGRGGYQNNQNHQFNRKFNKSGRGRSFYNTNNNRGRPYQRNGRHVRYMEASENSEAPQQRRGGEMTNTPNEI